MRRTTSRRDGGRLRAPATMVLAAVLVLTYVGFQGGGLALGPSRGLEFRCNAVEYGVIPYEVTHAGSQLTDPWCQPQAESLLHSGEEAAEEAGHEHPRTDPGIVADAPAPLTFLTSMIATIGSAGAVTAVIGAHLALVRGTRLTPLDLPAPALLGAWALLQVAAANLDAAQPVAGEGGDIVYLVPISALTIGLLVAVRAHPRSTPEAAHAQHRPH